jgi:pimeloyl-ACP methyl ester carboxylesterase
MVLRPPAAGSDARYVKYSQDGPRVGGENAKVITIPDLGFKAAVHTPRAAEGRLVVFSHGALADPQVYRPLLAHWASHGFVVVAPIHDDSVIERGLLSRRDDPRTGTSWEIKRLLGDVNAWQQRALMCSDVLNAIETVSRLVGCRILADRAVIVGHDYGAYCAQLMLGMTAESEDGGLDMPDTRYIAAIALSPQGTGVMGLTGKSWAKVERPMMWAVAGLENDANNQGFAPKQDGFKYAPGSYRHLALERGASAQWFSGQKARVNSDESAMFDDLKAATLAFLLAYVDRDEQAFKDLYGDWFGVATSRRMDLASR